MTPYQEDLIKRLRHWEINTVTTEEAAKEIERLIKELENPTEKKIEVGHSSNSNIKRIPI